jgi:signal transduction histidine kinase
VTRLCNLHAAWLVGPYLGLGTGGIVAFHVVGSPLAKTVLACAVVALGLAAVLGGLALRRPSRWEPWALVAVLVASWLVGDALWYGSVIPDGLPPEPGSLTDVIYVTGNSCLVVALAGVLCRKSGLGALLDAATIAVSVMVFGREFIIERYVESPAFTIDGKAAMITYAVLDGLVLGLGLRLLIAPGGRTPSGLLALAGAAAMLYSDGAWNWLTVAGAYTPGVWDDSGWLAAALLLGAAALVSSMRGLGDPAEAASESGRRWTLVPVSVAVVVPPVVLFLPGGRDDLEDIVSLAVGGFLVSAVIIGRFVVELARTARLRRQLAERNEHLLELDRMKDHFVSTVSHELRAPLTSIRGYLELVLSGDAGDLRQEQQRLLEVADRNAGRLIAIVDDLLFVARVDAGRLVLEAERVDLGGVVAESVETSLPRARERDVRLVAEVPEDLVLEGADRSRLVQLVDNLVSNAIKFTPPGGVVAVRAFADGAVAALEVADTGIGMDRDEQVRLFERFYRTRSATAHAIPGTGLGLSIVKAIAEAHGGAVTVMSEPGEGTTFRVTLPVAAAGAGPRPPAVAGVAAR